MPGAPNIVVIVVDRLGSGWLGPYGNTWVQTPGLNRLAAESVVCEFALSNSYELGAVYRSYLTGLPPLCTLTPTWPSLPELAAGAEYQTLLISDQEEVAAGDVAQGFQDSALVKSRLPARLAATVRETRTADLFQAAVEELGRLTQPALLWLHAGGLNTAWDAPYELRERLAAEDDPQPPKLIEPPSLELAKHHDPDELLGFLHAYAGEVMALDESLGLLLESIDAVCDPANTLLVFTSPRGFALGEHLRVGRAGDTLRGEVLQVPMIVRFPGRAGRLTRLTGLHEPADVFTTIAAQLRAREIGGWGLDLAEAQGSGAAHELVCAQAGDELVLRTPDWFFRRVGTGDEQQVELYAKPEDHWEVNEVSGRASDVVEGFKQLAEWFTSQCDLPGRPILPELPEALRAPRR